MSNQIQWDANGYHIGGHPTWLLSGEIHYFKLTRGDWRRRLLQLKCAGFNTVSVYMPWNYHEVVEGVWDFSGDKDVEHFLALAAELGLYVVARPGPFICDEWQAGGLPPWLGSKKGLRPRTQDPLYLSYVDKWWDRIAPLIAKYELGAGGTVIMAQVENEYGHFGIYQEEPYIFHLRDGLRSRGVSVPIINCDSFIQFPRLRFRVYDGINLCCNFGGDGIRNLAKARAVQKDAPLFVTEFWIAAFDWWGRNGSALYADDAALNNGLEIAAGGAGGLTAFVFSGGAHFGYWHGCSICSDDNFMTTLYGPGAPVLDDGRFSGKYSLFKTLLAPLALEEFARAGMPELSEPSPGLLKSVRRSPSADFIFHLNRTSEQARIAAAEKDQACVDMSIPAGAVRWSVRNLPLAHGFVLKEIEGLNLFAAEPALVLYGDPGMKAAVEIAGPGTVSTEKSDPGLCFAETETSLRIEAVVPVGDDPLYAVVTSGSSRLDLLILNRQAVERSWVVSLPGAPKALIGGVDRIEDATVENGKLALTVSSAQPRACWRLSNGTVVTESLHFSEPFAAGTIPLSDICVAFTLPEKEPDFDTASWTQSERPLPMAAFGHGTGKAWYRTTLHVVAGGPQMVYFSGACDRAMVFVDGRLLGIRGSHTHTGWNVMPSLSPGDHTLALLVENLGMFNSGAEYDVPLCEPKGLFGPVWMNGEEVTGWRMRAGIAAGERIDFWRNPGPAFWETSDGSACKGPAWIKATFELPNGFDGAVRFELGKYAGKGSLWLNGHNVGRYWKIGPQQSLWLPLSWLEPVNEVVLFEELEIEPSRLAVRLDGFGCQARWTIADAPSGSQ